MAEFEPQRKSLTVKVVYYGPALSGKTTNLMALFEHYPPEGRGDLMMINTKGDRTIFFDLLPLLLEIGGGIRLKLKLYTVPGQVIHDATRKAVLSRSDGVAFIADSQRDQAVNNYESFLNLEKNVARVGLDFETLPLVIQFNKRDLEDIVSEDEIRQRWAPTGLPILMASALYNRGVRETFLTLLRLTLLSVAPQFELDRYGFTEEGLMPRLESALGGPDDLG